MVRVSIPQKEAHCQNWVGAQWVSGNGESMEVECPLTGASIGKLQSTTAADLADCIANSQEAAARWAG